MWVVIKNKFKRTEPLVVGGKSRGYRELSIDRVVDSLDEVKKGELFFKCNIKN